MHDDKDARLTPALTASMERLCIELVQFVQWNSLTDVSSKRTDLFHEEHEEHGEGRDRLRHREVRVARETLVGQLRRFRQQVQQERAEEDAAAEAVQQPQHVRAYKSPSSVHWSQSPGSGL